MRKFCLVTLFICILNSTTLGIANNLNLKKLLDSFSSFQAGFTQVTKNSGSENAIEATGNVKIVKPNKFIWQIKKPQQLFISNGKDLWQYDKSLNQVIVTKINKKLDKAPALLLSNNATDLDKVFIIKQLNAHSFKLIPKQKDSVLKYMILNFTDKKISSMVIINNLGQSTQIHFNNVQTNVPMTNVDFAFVPPKGSDVIYN